MYAKLVVGNAPISALNAMRDIGRLITSTAPSTANLLAFSTSSSIIVDSTPAGWTYVGSKNANDQPTICATNTNWQDNVQSNLCFSAPTLANSSVLKYCALTIIFSSISANTNSSNVCFTLTGAQSATSSGVLTNEGYRMQSTNNPPGTCNLGLTSSAGKTLHVIANQRHLTIIQESNGFQGVWETSQTDLHTSQNIAPFTQVSLACGLQNSGVTGTQATVGYMTSNAISPSIGGSVGSNTGVWLVFNITDPNTGTNYGTYDVSEYGIYDNNFQPQINSGNFAINHISTSLHSNSLSAAGAQVYIIEPIYFNVSKHGYPTQFVTGIVPVYYCSPNMGNSGDTVNVQGDTYTFFNASATGFLMKTS